MGCRSSDNTVKVKEQSNEVNYSTLPQSLPSSILINTNGVDVLNGGFGSGAAAHPTRKGEFYVITDRGPNTDYLDGKKFLVPDFSPTILHFKINAQGYIEVIRKIPLRNPSGKPITGLPNPEGMGSTGETAYNLNGGRIGTDPFGLDPESIVAAQDGTFWVSDEYGPHIVHYSGEGIELERISPMGVNTGGRKIPAVFAKRRPNRGMEGLCITPDGKKLVGIMQSAMYVPSKKEMVNKTLTRILIFDLRTGETQQYLYRQESKKSDSNSDITAISSNEFLVVERDGEYGSKGGIKKIYRINLNGATQVNGKKEDPNGLLVNGKPLEACSWEELTNANIRPVSKALVVDLVESLGYEHDKLEGIVYLGNNQIAVFNDDDFGVVDNGSGTPVPKLLPKTGKVDAGSMYVLTIR